MLGWLVRTTAAAALLALGFVMVIWAHGPPRDAPAVVIRVPAPPTEDYLRIESVLSRRSQLSVGRRAELAAAIEAESRRAKYDPLLVMAIMDVESDYLETAVSSAGARGLMQMQPLTQAWLLEREGFADDLSREDPTLDVRLAIRYLRFLHDNFGSLELALMAYNAGPNRLRDAIQERDLSAFRGYVQAVRSEFLRAREVAGLPGDWKQAQRRAATERN